MENKPLTIKELYKHCKEQIECGNGDNVIMISNDDEGNGYHYCWYSFTEVDEYTQDFVDEEIAPADKTMILG